MTEVFDDVGMDGRRSVTGVCPPRQSRRRLGHVGYGWLRRRSGERRRLGSPVEDDGRIGGCFDDQRSTPGRLTGLARRLARVPAGVRLTKIYPERMHITQRLKN